MICFHVDALPIAQPRPRAGMRFAKGGKKVAGIYKDDSHPVHAWKEEVGIRAREAYQGEPLGKVPVSLSACFLMPRPQAMKHPEDRAWHLIKPDTDNLVKAVKDALTGLIWEDDSIVCREIVTKKYVAIGENPSATVIIEVINE